MRLPVLYHIIPRFASPAGARKGENAMTDVSIVRCADYERVEAALLEALAPFGGEGAELRALAESLADRQT